MPADFDLMTILWRNGLVAIPVALAVIVLCRAMPFRPSTRHALWVLVMASFLMPPALHTLWNPATLKPVESETPIVEAVDSSSGDALREQSASTGTAREPSNAGAERRSPRTLWSTPLGGLNNAGRSVGSLSPLTERSTGSNSTAWRDELATELHDASSLYSTWPYGPDVHASPSTNDPVRAFNAHPAAPVREEQPLRADTNETPSTNAALKEIAPPRESASEGPHWSNVFFAVRDALTNAPRIPAWWWASGVVAIALVFALRTLKFRHVVRHAYAATGEVNLTVIREAQALGLRHAPRTLMVREAISPMVWCGRRPTLLLPVRLWNDLDQESRRAVIVHELAHLKRRDHWVCWAALLIGTIYWWHPLTWWLQRRLRDEADLSCDAWVTTLLPKARKAYAQALLTTRMFLTNDLTREAPRPAVGLGAISPRTRGFARRLTMVMTNQNAPTMSRGGLALVCALAVSAGLSAPLWACPPEEKPAKTTAPAAPKPVSAPKAPSAPKADEAESTFERFMQERDGAAVQEETRLKDLEGRLTAMQRRLERMLAEQFEDGGGITVSATGRGDEPVIIVGDGDQMVYTTTLAAMGDEVVAREYKLPAGKLKELTELMIRQDVPVLVEPRDKSIVVHATPKDHEIFARFVKLIHPEAEVEVTDRVGAVNLQREREYELALRAAELARRNVDVECLRSDAEKVRREAELHADKARQEALDRAAVERARALEDAAVAREHALSQAMKAREKAMQEAMKAREKALHDAEKHVHERMNQAHKQLESQHKALEHKLAEIEASIAALKAKARDAKDDDRARLHDQIEELRNRAEEIREHREELHEHFGELQEHMHEMMQELQESFNDADFDVEFDFDFDSDSATARDSDRASDRKTARDSDRATASDRKSDSDRSSSRQSSSSSDRSSSSSSKRSSSSSGNANSSSSSAGGRLQ